jgi:predicted hotdog family 3-hydroxylacyl-ACP dehydratase
VLKDRKLYELIPQSFPFIMIDSILLSDETETITRFSVSSDNILSKNGIFREPGIIENIAQTAAARSGIAANKTNTPLKTGYIGSIKNLIINFLPEINQILETRITLKTEIGNITVIEGQTKCLGKIVASCEMTIIELA